VSTSQLINVLEDWTNALELGKSVDVIFKRVLIEFLMLYLHQRLEHNNMGLMAVY